MTDYMTGEEEKQMGTVCKRVFFSFSLNIPFRVKTLRRILNAQDGFRRETFEFERSENRMNKKKGHTR